MHAEGSALKCKGKAINLNKSNYAITAKTVCWELQLISRYTFARSTLPLLSTLQVHEEASHNYILRDKILLNRKLAFITKSFLT
jgi:hypothetical protein